MPCLQNRRNSLPSTVKTSRQWSWNQSVGYLLCSMARINVLWYGSLDKCRVRGLVPCCSQDGYRAQVPQHSIDLYRYKQISSTKTDTWAFSYNYILYFRYIALLDGHNCPCFMLKCIVTNVQSKMLIPNGITTGKSI